MLSSSEGNDVGEPDIIRRGSQVFPELKYSQQLWVFLSRPPGPWLRTPVAITSKNFVINPHLLLFLWVLFLFWGYESTGAHEALYPTLCNKLYELGCNQKKQYQQETQTHQDGATDRKNKQKQKTQSQETWGSVLALPYHFTSSVSLSIKLDQKSVQSPQVSTIKKDNLSCLDKQNQNKQYFSISPQCPPHIFIFRK